jgi:hypothetical protein
MPFLEKLANIAVSGQHVGDMSATFPAKIISRAGYGQISIILIEW